VLPVAPAEAVKAAKALFRGIRCAGIAAMPWADKTRRCVRSALAGLMAAMLLVLTLLASHEKVHAALHQDAAESHPLACAVCSVAQGQWDVPHSVVPEVVTTLSVTWTVACLEPLTLQGSDFSVASSRGPPASVSSR
jgi:hypothetical protein